LNDISNTKKVDILGVKVDRIRLDEVIFIIQEAIQQKKRILVSNVNIQAINLACEQEWFRQFLNSSDVVYCDGMGVLLGARLLGYDIPERFTPADWVWTLVRLCSAQRYSIFLLGNPPGIVDAAADMLKEEFPELHIVGTHHGYFDKSKNSLENQFVIDLINSKNPDILFVGFGMPIQEKWLSENWSQIQVNVAMPCGALFEYLSGNLKRGPRWMTDNYLEWLARVVISPARYFKRYLRDIPLFTYRIIKRRISQVAK